MDIRRTRPEIVALCLSAAAILAVALLPPTDAPGRSGMGGEPFVDREVLSAALASKVPEQLTMSDEIGYFEHRLARRGDEAFSRERLLSAHLLRFRAYGRDEDLNRSVAHLAALTDTGESGAGLEARRAALALARHDFRGAVVAAERADRIAQGSDPAVRLALFDALWASGEYARAAAHLDGPFDRSSIGWLSRHARLLDRRGRVEEARDAFREVVEQVRAFAQPAPVEAWALVELGHFEYHSGDPGAGVDRYLEALEVLPGSPAALEGLAAVAAGVDRRPRVAERLYRAALDRGAHLEVALALADAQDAAGDARAAEATRSNFLARATTTDESVRLHRQGIALTLAGRSGAAARCRALDLASEELRARREASAWSTMAWVRYRLGHLDEARRAAARSVAWGAPEPAVAFRAGVVLAAVDDPGAPALLEEALEGASELTATEVDRARTLLDGASAEAEPDRVSCEAPGPSA